MIKHPVQYYYCFFLVMDISIWLALLVFFFWNNLEQRSLDFLRKAVNRRHSSWLYDEWALLPGGGGGGGGVNITLMTASSLSLSPPMSITLNRRPASAQEFSNLSCTLVFSLLGFIFASAFCFVLFYNFNCRYNLHACMFCFSFGIFALSYRLDHTRQLWFRVGATLGEVLYRPGNWDSVK